MPNRLQRIECICSLTTVVAYEILPPREKDGTLNSYAETISSLLSQTHIDAINIPEINIAFTTPERIAKSPPKSVKTTVVIQPIPLE